MATVQGVQGPIEAEQLGLTLIHEHFFSSDEAVTAQWPHVRDRETEHRLAVESAEADLAGPDRGNPVPPRPSPNRPKKCLQIDRSNPGPDSSLATTRGSSSISQTTPSGVVSSLSNSAQGGLGRKMVLLANGSRSPT